MNDWWIFWLPVLFKQGFLAVYSSKIKHLLSRVFITWHINTLFVVTKVFNGIFGNSITCAVISILFWIIHSQFIFRPLSLSQYEEKCWTVKLRKEKYHVNKKLCHETITKSPKFFKRLWKGTLILLSLWLNMHIPNLCCHEPVYFLSLKLSIFSISFNCLMKPYNFLCVCIDHRAIWIKTTQVVFHKLFIIADIYS